MSLSLYYTALSRGKVNRLVFLIYVEQNFLYLTKLKRKLNGLYFKRCISEDYDIITL